MQHADSWVAWLTAKRAATLAKWLTIMGAVVGFLWNVSSALQTRAIDARRPFLNLQLNLYQEAASTAANLATSTDPAELRRAEARFWQLYWGELAMVENGGFKPRHGGVEGAMVRFGHQLRADSANRSALQQQSLCLSHTLRDSLAESWGVTDWRAPDYRGSPEYQKCSELDKLAMDKLLGPAAQGNALGRRE
jgi:hypothetical protein